VTKVYFNKVKILPQLLDSDGLKPKAQHPLSQSNNVYALIQKLYMYCYQRLALMYANYYQACEAKNKTYVGGKGSQTISCNKFLIIYLLDAQISQIYFWNETLQVSDSSSVHHQEFFTVHTTVVYVIHVC
jgi:hypothetical protein